MRQDLQESLFNNYPEFFQQRLLPMSMTCMCWGIDTGDGWFEVIRRACGDIRTVLTDNKVSLNSVQATQVKEKFGGLRMYLHFEDLPQELEKDIDEIVERAEDASFRTCEKCGSIADVETKGKGWITTLCSSCRNGSE